MKGLKAAGSIRITGGSFSIDSADDAVHSNASITINGGTFEIATGDDGVHADETLTVTDGTIDISVSYEGLEALDVCIEGGDISLVADDDGLNAAGGTDSSGTSGGSSSSNGSISISGGNLHITASGDGIDANGSLTISGGTFRRIRYGTELQRLGTGGCGGQRGNAGGRNDGDAYGSGRGGTSQQYAGIVFRCGDPQQSGSCIRGALYAYRGFFL